MEDTKLARSIGLTGAVAITVGCVIGMSIFVLIGDMAFMAGPALPLAFLFALIPALFNVITVAQLGSAIPRAGGGYVFTTPHEYVGPSDVSKVLDRETPEGMHLKEYRYKEIRSLLAKAGFGQIYAVMFTPQKVDRVFGTEIKSFKSSLYFTYLLQLEKLLSIIPDRRMRRKAALLARFLFFNGTIFIYARKKNS